MKTTTNPNSKTVPAVAMLTDTDLSILQAHLDGIRAEVAKFENYVEKLKADYYNEING